MEMFFLFLRQKEVGARAQLFTHKAIRRVPGESQSVQTEPR
jgi:hypothetical protein